MFNWVAGFEVVLGYHGKLLGHSMVVTRIFCVGVRVFSLADMGLKWFGGF